RPVLHAVRRADAACGLVPRLPQLRQHERLQLTTTTCSQAPRGEATAWWLRPAGRRPPQSDREPPTSSRTECGPRPTEDDVQLSRFDANAAADEVAAALDRHGSAIVERLVPADVCDAVAAELDPWIGRTPTGGDDFTGRRTR